MGIVYWSMDVSFIGIIGVVSILFIYLFLPIIILSLILWIQTKIWRLEDKRFIKSLIISTVLFVILSIITDIFRFLNLKYLYKTLFYFGIFDFTPEWIIGLIVTFIYLVVILRVSYKTTIIKSLIIAVNTLVYIIICLFILPLLLIIITGFRPG